MNLRNLYELFVKEGVREDLRTRAQVEKAIFENKNKYKKSKVPFRKYFDVESLKNPYSDTRILFGDPNLEIKRVLVGIDIDVSEILLADRLSSIGKKIDLVIAHHPEGIAWAGLDEVMNLQTDVLKNLGVEEGAARGFMQKRIADVAQRLHSSNHLKVRDAARLLNIPFMCCHTPADNHVARYLQTKIDSKKPKYLKDLVGLLLSEPEYNQAAFDKAGPEIFLGKEKDLTGRVFVDMTGGTSGPKDVYPRLSQIGIKTILGMHMSKEYLDKVKAEYMNVVIAGHIASDSLGMNLLLDKVCKKANIEIVECSGFRRFKRSK